MGRCLACSSDSKEVSVARAEGTKRRMLDGIRDVSVSRDTDPHGPL